MIDMLNSIVSVNFLTAVIVATMVAATGVIFREMTNSTLMTVLFVPFLAFGALASIYGLSHFGIMFSSNRDSNAVVSSGFGMVIALSIMLAVIRLWHAIADMRRPPDAAGRLLDTDEGR